MAQILNFPQLPDAGYHCGDPHCTACTEPDQLGFMFAADVGLDVEVYKTWAARTPSLADSADEAIRLLQEYRQLKDIDTLRASLRKVEIDMALREYGLFFLTRNGV